MPTPPLLPARAQAMLVKEFEAIAVHESFSRLPASLLIEALQRDSLYVSSEESVFEGCVRWLELQPSLPSAEVLDAMLACIRFHTMDLLYLRQHVVPRDCIVRCPRIAAALKLLASPSRRAKRPPHHRDVSSPGRATATAESPAAKSPALTNGTESSKRARRTASTSTPEPPATADALSPMTHEAAATRPKATAEVAEGRTAESLLIEWFETPARKRVALLRNSDGLVFRYGTSTTPQGQQAPLPGLFHTIGTDSSQQPWHNPARTGEVVLRRRESIFGNWIELETEAPGESAPLLDHQFFVQSWRLGAPRPPSTLRRFYHQLIIDLGETRSFLLTNYCAMIEPRNNRGETEVRPPARPSAKTTRAIACLPTRLPYAHTCTPIGHPHTYRPPAYLSPHVAHLPVVSAGLPLDPRGIV